jgi:hypothetical protein
LPKGRLFVVGNAERHAESAHDVADRLGIDGAARTSWHLDVEPKGSDDTRERQSVRKPLYGQSLKIASQFLVVPVTNRSVDGLSEQEDEIRARTDQPTMCLIRNASINLPVTGTDVKTSSIIDRPCYRSIKIQR